MIEDGVGFMEFCEMVLFLFLYDGSVYKLNIMHIELIFEYGVV